MSSVVTPGDVEPSVTWLEAVPVAYRRKRGLVPVAISLLLAGWLGLVQFKDGILGKPESIWLVIILAVGAWRYRSWQQRDTVRRFQAEEVALTLPQRAKKARPLLIFGFGGAALVLALQLWAGGIAQNWVIPAFMFLPFGLAGVAICAFLRKERVLSSEAAKMKAFYDAQDKVNEGVWADRLGSLLALKIVRYPGAALLVWAAYYFANDPQSKPWVWAAFAIWAAVAAKELALWLLGAGLVIGVLVLGFNMLAAIPVSIAIIIGALIIAGAVKR